MIDKVQKIREELLRLKEETSIGLSERENGIEQGRMEIINALSLFLDSLQEEPNDDWKYSIAEKLGISREEYDKIDYNKDYGKEDYLSESLDIKYKVENKIEEGDKDE